MRTNQKEFEDLEGFKFFDVINKIEMILFFLEEMLKVNCANFALYKVKRFRALWFWMPEGSFFIYLLNVEFILININAKESFINRLQRNETVSSSWIVVCQVKDFVSHDLIIESMKYLSNIKSY